MHLGDQKARQSWPLLLLWAAMAAVIWPVGEFSINDDWGFSLPVEWWVTHKDLQFTFWQHMTLITQIWAGYAWSEIFGFSQLNLRILVALCSAGTVLLTLRLSDICGLDRRWGILITLCLLSFPLYPGLSLSFMTDIPFMLLLLGTLCVLTRALQTEKSLFGPFFFAGAALLLLTLLLRQTAIAIAAGFLLADLIRHGFKLQATLRGMVLLAISAGVIIFFPPVAALFTEFPVNYSDNVGAMKFWLAELMALHPTTLLRSVVVACYSLLYNGFFALPLSLSLAFALRAHLFAGRVHVVLILALSAALFAVTYLTGGSVPQAGNVLTFEGLGPRLLAPGLLQPASYPAAWLILSALSALSAALIIYLFASQLIGLLKTRFQSLNRSELSLHALLLSTAVILMLPFAMRFGPWFDRYMICSAPLVLMSAAMLIAPRVHALPQISRTVYGFAAVGIVASVILTHDYFQWARTRTALVEGFVAQTGIAPEDMDGGFEYNNVLQLHQNRSDAAHIKAIRTASRPYMISKTLRPGYTLVSCTDVGQWVPLDADRLYILKKIPGETIEVAGTYMSAMKEDREDGQEPFGTPACR